MKDVRHSRPHNIYSPRLFIPFFFFPPSAVAYWSAVRDVLVYTVHCREMGKKGERRLLSTHTQAVSFLIGSISFFLSPILRTYNRKEREREKLLYRTHSPYVSVCEQHLAAAAAAVAGQQHFPISAQGFSLLAAGWLRWPTLSISATHALLPPAPRTSLLFLGCYSLILYS